MNKQFVIYALIIVLVFFMNSVSFAQNVLGKLSNQIQPGDSVSRIEVEYMDPGEFGTDIVWDFSGIGVKDTNYVKYDSIGGSHLVETGQKFAYKYKISKDSLMIIGYESPLTEINFHHPRLQLLFPFQLHQEAIAEYAGEGRYCGKFFERTFGTIKIKADGEGTIILSENDTLPNTLRIYTVNTASLRLSADSCRNDSDNLKQVITEHYQWFARGYRYPVFETVTSSTYDNLEHISTCQYAYRCSPEIQEELNDTINEQIREADRQTSYNNRNQQSAKDTSNHSNGNIFNYDVQSNGNQFTITYSLTETSHVHAMVVDVMGNIYRDIQQSNAAGSDYSMYFDCSGLRPGQYIIYINVNGTIYNVKIPVK